MQSHVFISFMLRCHSLSKTCYHVIINIYPLTKFIKEAISVILHHNLLLWQVLQILQKKIRCSNMKYVAQQWGSFLVLLQQNQPNQVDLSLLRKRRTSIQIRKSWRLVWIFPPPSISGGNHSFAIGDEKIQAINTPCHQVANTIDLKHTNLDKGSISRSSSWVT